MTDDLFASALEHSTESVSIYALDSTVIFMNPANERIMGVAFSKLRGKRLFAELPDEVGGAFHAAFVAVADGDASRAFEHFCLRVDGWFAGRVLRIGDRIHVYARDVTDDVRRRRRLDTLARIAEVFTRPELDPPAASQAVVEILTDVVCADCLLARLSNDGEWLETVARSAHAARTNEIFKVPPRWRSTVGNSAEALRTRAPVLHVGNRVRRADDANIHDLLDEYQLQSMAVVPLIVDDEPIGVLGASRPAGTVLLTHHDTQLLGEIAPSVALFMKNADHRAETSTLRSRLTAMADALPALASFVDTSQCYQYVNAAYERWFGGPRERYLGRKLTEMMGQAYATVEPYVLRALAGEAVRFRARLEYPTGARDVDAHYIPIKGSDGTVEAFAMLVSDISNEVRMSEVEQAHRALERRATARLESLLSLTGRLATAQRPDDITRELVDGGGDALDAASSSMWQLSDDGAEALLVRERGLDPRHTMERLPIASAAAVGDCLTTGRPVFIASRKEYDAQYPEVEQRFRSEDRPPSAFVALPLQTNGTPACLVFSFHDERQLTPDERTYLEILSSHGSEALRRAHALGELHDASELQAAIIHSSPTAIMLLDRLGVVRMWNQAAEQMFGWSAAEVIGHPVAMADQLEAKLQAVLAGEEVLRIETRRQRANGEWFDVEIYGAPVRRSTDETLCLVIVLDISERKAIERTRQQMIEDAQRARADAEAANRSKDEFLAMLGHELRNPLAPLVTALELMRMRGGHQFERERAVLERQVHHLSRLVDDLLDVSRITRGKIELRREHAGVGDIVRKAVEQTSPLFDERRHHIAIDVAPGLVVNGDPTRLAQVLSNLLSNAAKYTPRGGRISVNARRVGDTIRIGVRDNGIGIAPAMLPHVFDLFVQAPQSSERPAGGLGLGLTIVRSLVLQHGGTVSVESQGVGKGTEFIVTLPSPLGEGMAVDHAHAAHVEKTAAARRVLVVDDNEDAAMLLADVLDAHGYDIRTAFDGPSALRIADEFHPEVAVLDIGLPVMDGYELAERLRATPSLKDVRLIAVTGYGQESDRRRSLDAGFQAHLAKPVEIETLVNLVEHS